MTNRSQWPARTVLLAVAGLLVAASAFAQDFWAKKEFNQWTDEEAKKVQSDSPWAKKMEVPRSTGPDTTNFVNLTIAWESSLPMRWANARMKMGKPGDVSPEVKASFDQPQTAYIIRISGMPADMVAMIEGDPEASKGSVLKIGKREIPVGKFGWAAAAATAPAAAPAAAPADAPGDAAGAGRGRRGGGGGGGGVPGVPGARGGGRGGGIDFFLIFPIQEPIKLEDGDNVEVNSKLGGFKISKAFKLKDMVVNGKLQL